MVRQLVETIHQRVCIETISAQAQDASNYMEIQFERPGLTMAEIEEVKQAFFLFDENQDGEKLLKYSSTNEN